MQHQQDVGNGAAQLNGNAAQTDSAFTVNGVSDMKKPLVKLDPLNKEMVRVIGQYLKNLGFKHTVEQLMSESGCRLDHPDAMNFSKCVLMGDWRGADDALQHLQVLLERPEQFTEMRFLLLEQKYMELLERGDDIAALTCLRGEISPLEHNVSRVHRLSSLIFYNNSSDLKRATNWQGSGADSRIALMHKLMENLPASLMLPPNRLEHLVIQALQHQLHVCPFHNTASGPLIDADNIEDLPMSKAITADGSILSDHRCGKENFPVACVQTVTDHTDEVLTAAFSPNGLYLATAGKDCTLIIWDVDQRTFSISRRHVLDSHSFSIVFLSWSPDSSKVIVCMQEDSAELIVWDADRGRQICKVADSTTDSLTCACWYTDNERFVCGGLRGQFFLCNLEGAVVERWEGVRLQSVAIHSDGKTVLASDTHRRIRGYQLEEVHDYSILQEDHGIMSFTIDTTGRFALLNVTTQGLHMWDLQDRTLVRKFRGITQGHCTIHSCFGGINDDFVASGSEDHKVYIWHRSREEPVTILTGHKKTVNCVTWNPTLPSMLASVSDDNSVRIWGPAASHRAKRDQPPAAHNGQLPDTLMSSLDISEH